VFQVLVHAHDHVEQQSRMCFSSFEKEAEDHFGRVGSVGNFTSYHLPDSGRKWASLMFLCLDLGFFDGAEFLHRRAGEHSRNERELRGIDSHYDTTIVPHNRAITVPWCHGLSVLPHN
jgi:hypothetical protein